MAPRHGASLVRHERGRTSLLEGLRLGHGYWRREAGKYHAHMRVGFSAARIVLRKVHNLA